MSSGLPVSLVFLLLSTASAFSPVALPALAYRSCGVPSPLHPLSQCRIVGQSSNHDRMKRPPPLNTPSSLQAASLAAQRQFKCKKRIATAMAFLTGWADFMFIKKYNFFATMMTGNSMKMAYALVDGRVRDACFFLSIIFAYVLGVGTFRRAEYSWKDRALRGLCAPVVAGCFVGSDVLSWSRPSWMFLPATLLSFAWGIINSVGSEVTGTLIFVVTGAMTRLSNMIVDRISRTAGRKRISREGALMSLSVIGGFIGGAAWSAFLSAVAPKLVAGGAFSIMGGIYGLLFLWLDREALGAWWSETDGKLCEIDADEVDCK